MGEVKKERILEILDGYDKENITIATLGSHTSLHILNGAKEEGFRTAIVCEKGREVPYERFGVADEFIMVDQFKDIVNEEVQEKLRAMNAIVVPHGSFVAYAGLDNVEDKFNVPMFGNRDILRWEAERDLERKLLASSFEEFNSKIEAMKARGWIEDEDVEQAHIEEYVSGCNYCIHYFYSALDDEVELMGMDSRYESSIDGFVRMPAKDQLDIDISPSYVVTGNHPVVIRESLLTQVFDIGDKLVKSAAELVKPGLNGPFCMQTLVNDNLEVVVFETSARTDGGTNTFMEGSAYTYLKYGSGMSMGRRVAREIKNGIERDELEKIIT